MLLENDQRYVNLRGEIFVYMACCLLFLNQARKADSKFEFGLKLITSELLRIEMHDEYVARRNAAQAGSLVGSGV